jgi:hypothetical protein
VRDFSSGIVRREKECLSKEAQVGTIFGTHVGPFAEWRVRERLGRNKDFDLFVFETGPYILSSTGGAEFRVTVEGIEYHREVVFPYPLFGSTAPFPRRMDFDGSALATQAVIEAVGTRIPLGRYFGAEVTLELAGVDPAAESAWFCEVYRPHLEQLDRHYGHSARISWGLVAYWG